MTKSGRVKILEQFVADGMTHMFGNPGTVEQGFLDALRDAPEMNYILALQESVAVMMADGYARATQTPALVQLHSSPGIGNGVGALYQAKRGHAPLVVIGGDAGLRYMNMDAQMAADLVAMMEPVTKYATMVLDPRSLLRTLRRAIKIAATPPMGPVYVCVPQDVLDEPNDEPVHPTCIPSTRVSPDASLILQTAQDLLAAERPRLYVGDGVAWSGATAALTEVAELLGAEVYGVDGGDVLMDTTHPCYRGTTGHMFGEHSLPITQQGDVNLIVGTYMLPEVFPTLGDIYAPDARVIHVDLDAYEIAKNHRVDVGVVADPRCALSALAVTIRSERSDAQAQRAQARITALEASATASRHSALSADVAKRDKTPLHMSAFAEALAQRVPQDVVLFDEALTNSPELTRYLPARRPGQCFTTRGGSLGVGFPGGIGIKLAHPDKTVIAFSGDGGSMYTIQALWSAARHGVGAKFVVCNNSSYRLLQLNVKAYWQKQGVAPHAQPPCFDLSRPALQFADLARSMGVDAVRVERPDQIEPAIERMLATDCPFLVDLVLEGDVHPELIGVPCGKW